MSQQSFGGKGTIGEPQTGKAGNVMWTQLEFVVSGWTRLEKSAWKCCHLCSHPLFLESRRLQWKPATFFKPLENRKRKIPAKPHPPHAVLFGQSILWVQASQYHPRSVSVELLWDVVLGLHKPLLVPTKEQAQLSRAPQSCNPKQNYPHRTLKSADMKHYINANYCPNTRVLKSCILRALVLLNPSIH